MTLLDAILEFNVPYRNVFKGAQIHEIDRLVASRMAQLVADNADRLRIDDSIPYFCAVMGQESRFDPKAFNRNLTPLEAAFGRTDNPGKGDYGAAMFKLMYVKVAADCPELHGLPEVDVLDGFLFNPDWAVPKMADRYAYRLGLAKQEFPNDDPLRVATGFYKAGIRGYRERINWPATVKHMDRVMVHYAWFKAALDEEE